MKTAAAMLAAAAGMGGAGSVLAQVAGPSTQQTSYVVASDPASGTVFYSIVSNGNGTTTPNETYTRLNGAAPYRMVGIPDGLGAIRTALDLIDGTFTLVANHELGANQGIARDHGSRGAFNSLWRVRTNPGGADHLKVIGGQDLQQQIKLYRVGSGYETYGPGNAMPPYANNVMGTGPDPNLNGFARFCSADLAAPTAYRFGALGTDARIIMNGEENGAPGRSMAHLVTGDEAGTSYELPRLGDASWENSVASPHAQEKTVVLVADDTTPGNIYLYVGTKTDAGTDVERAGLTNGVLYAVGMEETTVQGTQRVEDRINILGNATSGPVSSKRFFTIDMGDVTDMTGDAIQAYADSAGQMNFLRPEDAAWDPSNPRRAYFVTTDSFTGNSRLWEVLLDDIAHPEKGGLVTMLADGSVPGSLAGGIHSATGATDVRMMDNFCVVAGGNLVITEDVGNNPRLGRVWLYEPSRDRMTELGISDGARFLSGGANFLTQDEEASGVVDASDIIGRGWILLDMQAHYGISGELAEGGQMIAAFVPQAVQGTCYADCNNDGVRNLSDFGCFQTKFALADAYADCNLDGVLNLSDFGCFQTKFALGCP